MVFVVWLGQYQFDHQYDLYRIVFQGPVRGLSNGGEVQFSGIKVGQIEHIALDDADPNKVIMDIEVTHKTPVRVDSMASSEMEGISGVNVIQISAGTPTKPLLRTVDHSGRPTIHARPDAFASLLLGGGQVLQATTEALGRVNRVLSDGNIASLTGAASDLRATTAALAAHRQMFAHLDQAASDIQASAATVHKLANGDGRHALADLASAAGDFKVTAREARATVARLDGQSGVIAATTIPKLNATLDSLTKAGDSLNGLVSDIHNDPRGLLVKPHARELEIAP